jgi:hypothetical protein
VICRERHIVGSLRDQVQSLACQRNGSPPMPTTDVLRRAPSCTSTHSKIRTFGRELHFAKVDVAGSNPVSRSVSARFT